MHTLTRNAGLAAVALTLSLGLSACGEDAVDSSAAADTPSQTTDESTPEALPSEEMNDDAMSAGDQTFGAGCKLIPANGAGSFNGMATEPVATAASANPLLKTLVTAVGEAGLGDTLNTAQDITVFAPTDDAFAKIPADTLDAVLADKATLTSILTHHVVAGQLAPDELAGKHETLNGDMVKVKGSGDMFTVGGEKAQVLCGNIPTANATVYVIDTVLMPS